VRDKLRGSTKQSPFWTTETPLGLGPGQSLYPRRRPVGNGDWMAHLRLLVFILPPVLLAGTNSCGVAAESMVGVADRLRRPAGAPL